MLNQHAVAVIGAISLAQHVRWCPEFQHGVKASRKVGPGLNDKAAGFGIGSPYRDGADRIGISIHLHGPQPGKGTVCTIRYDSKRQLDISGPVEQLLAQWIEHPQTQGEDPVPDGDLFVIFLP